MVQPRIRQAIEADIPRLLPLMHELAVFEKCDQAFAVTEEGLREQGFRRSPPDFHCLVAEDGEALLGFLVYYFVPFTYRGKPNLIIKELYVVEAGRSQRVGESLMRAAAKEAVRAGCATIKWWVAKWNHRGIQFYERLGGRIDPDWHEFQLSQEAIEKLAVP